MQRQTSCGTADPIGCILLSLHLLSGVLAAGVLLEAVGLSRQKPDWSFPFSLLCAGRSEEAVDLTEEAMRRN